MRTLDKAQRTTMGTMSRKIPLIIKTAVPAMTTKGPVVIARS
jgi:hypothetical protein